MAALGYVSFAVAALIIAVGGFLKPSKRVYKDFSTSGKEVEVQHLGISSSVIWAIVFFIIGIVLVGFRTPG